MIGQVCHFYSCFRSLYFYFILFMFLYSFRKVTLEMKLSNKTFILCVPSFGHGGFLIRVNFLFAFVHSLDVRVCPLHPFA